MIIDKTLPDVVGNGEYDPILNYHKIATEYWDNLGNYGKGMVNHYLFHPNTDEEGKLYESGIADEDKFNALMVLMLVRTNECIRI